MTNISNWFFRLAVLYLIAGIGLGIFMAASGNHGMHPVHAHLNLLGWVTLALFGAFYRLWPQAAATKLSKVHFWLFVPSHFVMMVALAALYAGNPAVEPILGVTSILVGIAILCFAVNVWRYTGSPAAATTPLGTAAAR